MSLTNYGENFLLDLLPALYLGLFTATPNDAGGGTEVSTSGTGYARQAADLDPAAGGARVNSSLIQFPTALAAWGTVSHWALFDADTGDMVWFGAFDQADPVNTGNIFQVQPGALTVGLD